METKSKILAFGVYYVPTKKGKLFAGLNPELQAAFNDNLEAIAYCDNLNQGSYLDEMHIGYRVYPMAFIPQGINVH